MLKRLYDKSNIAFAIAWIVAYCLFMSAGDLLSASLGVEKSGTLAAGLVLSAVLLLFLKKNGLSEAYGLCRPAVPPQTMLFYIPLLIMLSVNLWCGVSMNLSIFETVLYILSMFCVGFLEEIIFRGLLFEAMRKDNVKSAIIVSSLTFGVGHIVNLVNGSGTELLANLLQLVYATAAGFMFVMIYYKSKSLLLCIAAHGIFNALSVFSNEANISDRMQILSAVFLSLITGGYGLYIALTLRGKPKNQ